MRERDSRLLPGLARQLFLVCILLSLASGNFLFVGEPLARRAPDGSDSEDLFGYATTLHRIDNSGEPNDFSAAIGNTRIIIGAPGGTFPGGLEFPPSINDSDTINRTGLVYMCPVVPGECEALRGDGTNAVRLFDNEGNEVGQVAGTDPVVMREFENKEGQFMGATLVSTGDHFIACAPRWVNIDNRLRQNFDLSRGHGRCFVSGRSLSDFEMLRPCTSGVSTNDFFETYCMSGTSAAILEETSPNTFASYLGSPPATAASGIVHEYSIPDEVPPPQSPSSFFHRSGFLYGGLAITLGRITSSSEINLISATPKSGSYVGSVRIFDRNSRSQIDEVFGSQMGEYFGWAVAAADLNGDEFDELIVGAPLFSTVDKIEKGRVLIFRNNMGVLDADNPIELLGTESKGRFGSAIVNLGDINSDGFEDIAISAPFADNGSGAEGSVYVFLGSLSDTITQTPNEIITALQISQTLGLDPDSYLQSFGYSMSGGVDVDANFNNDLVIGGYKSKTVIVLRSYSIANVSLSLATNPPDQLEYRVRDQENTCEFGTDMFACFEVIINGSFSGRGLDGRSLDTMVSVRENIVETPRLFFEGSGGERADEYVGNLSFAMTDEDTIITVTVYVENDIADRRTPLGVVVNVGRIKNPERMVDGNDELIDLRDYPLLNVFPQNDLEIDMALAGCADPTNCQPNMTLTLIRTTYEEDIAPDPDKVTITVNSGEQEQLEILLNYRTVGDDANNLYLLLTLPSNVFGAPGISGGFNCSSVTEGQYNCGLETIISEFDGVFSVALTIPIRDDLVGDEGIVNIPIQLRSSDVDRDISDNMVDVTVNVAAENMVNLLDLSFTPNTLVYNTDEDEGEEFGNTVSLTLNIFASGPTYIPMATVSFYIPRDERTGELYYLYPARVSHTGESMNVKCAGVNPDGIPEFEQARKRRRKRSVSYMDQLFRAVQGKKEEEEVVIHKKQEDARTCSEEQPEEDCLAVVCDVSNITEGSASISLILALDNRFFNSRSGDFRFIFRATYAVVSSFFDSQQESVPSNVFVVQEFERERDTPIPIYVYVISVLLVLIGLVVIIVVIVLVVYFLRRRTKKKINRIRRDTERRRSLNRTAGATVAVTSLDEKPTDPDKPAETDGANGTDETDEKPKPPPGDEVKPDEPPEPSAPAEDPDETEL